MKPIFIYGSSAVDITAYGDGDVQLSPGGKASNQAVAAFLYGAEDVRLATLITSDRMGHFLVDYWRDIGLPTETVQRLHASNGHPTGISIVTLAADNTPIIVRGDNVGKYPDDVHKERWIKQIPENGIFITQFSANLQTSIELAKIAKEQGNLIVVDPAPATEVPDDFWDIVDVVTPNSNEARYYRKLPVTLTIETLGKHGVAVNGTHVPGIPVDAVDATGSGDAFVGALAAKLSQGWKFEEAVKYANCAGALSATRKGASVSFASKAEVDELYETVYINGNLPIKKSAPEAESIPEEEAKPIWITKSTGDSASAEPAVPKKRGRPKKVVDASAAPAVPAVPKKRGRPKKIAAPVINEAASTDAIAENSADAPYVTETVSAEPAAPKKRGRPKKEKPEVPAGEKRGRGRPKKIQS
ncbi:MAG: PfkB family carbohydrate kinase [Oscillospiraceae bacterium]|nr:PfkB family carbohydrate kinase [Oscillospiraceae bacterium]